MANNRSIGLTSSVLNFLPGPLVLLVRFTGLKQSGLNTETLKWQPYTGIGNGNPGGRFTEMAANVYMNL